MSQKSIILFSILFVVLVAGMFTYAHLKRAEILEPTNFESVVIPGPEYGITRIEAKHFFIDGEHTIVGSLTMPTPCDLVTAASRVAESMPEQVTFDFSVLNNSESCVQVTTPARFKVSATASALASLAATFMGKPVELNLIEAEPGETPESFELYIKG